MKGTCLDRRLSLFLLLNSQHVRPSLQGSVGIQYAKSKSQCVITDRTMQVRPAPNRLTSRKHCEFATDYSVGQVDRNHKTVTAVRCYLQDAHDLILATSLPLYIACPDHSIDFNNILCDQDLRNARANQVPTTDLAPSNYQSCSSYPSEDTSRSLMAHISSTHLPQRHVCEIHQEIRGCS